MFTRAVTVALLTLATLAPAAPASASHTHVLQLPDGRCVILAQYGNEKFVKLPNEDEFAEDRRHPLHAKVHLGEPGTRNGEQVVYVRGSADDVQNCSSYANG